MNPTSEINAISPPSEYDNTAFTYQIPGGLLDKDCIEIHGKLNGESARIELITDSKIEILPLQLEFNANGCWYVNSCGESGKPVSQEGKIKFSGEILTEFEISIISFTDYYEIFLNQEKICAQRHVVPLSKVTHLAIDGEADFVGVEFRDSVPENNNIISVSDVPAVSNSAQYNSPKVTDFVRISENRQSSRNNVKSPIFVPVKTRSSKGDTSKAKKNGFVEENVIVNKEEQQVSAKSQQSQNEKVKMHDAKKRTKKSKEEKKQSPRLKDSPVTDAWDIEGGVEISVDSRLEYPHMPKHKKGSHIRGDTESQNQSDKVKTRNSAKSSPHGWIKKSKYDLVEAEKAYVINNATFKMNNDKNVDALANKPLANLKDKAKIAQISYSPSNNPEHSSQSEILQNKAGLSKNRPSSMASQISTPDMPIISSQLKENLHSGNIAYDKTPSLTITSKTGSPELATQSQPNEAKRINRKVDHPITKTGSMSVSLNEIYSSNVTLDPIRHKKKHKTSDFLKKLFHIKKKQSKNSKMGQVDFSSKSQTLPSQAKSQSQENVQRPSCEDDYGAGFNPAYSLGDLSREELEVTSNPKLLKRQSYGESSSDYGSKEGQDKDSTGARSSGGKSPIEVKLEEHIQQNVHSGLPAPRGGAESVEGHNGIHSPASPRSSIGSSNDWIIEVGLSQKYHERIASFKRNHLNKLQPKISTAVSRKRNDNSQSSEDTIY